MQITEDLLEMNLCILGADVTALDNLPLPSSVEALVLSNPEPMWLTGHARRDEECIWVEFPILPAPVEMGTKVILNFPLQKAPMITMVVNILDGNGLRLQLAKIHERDKRTFPRHFGNIPLKIRNISQMEEPLLKRQWIQNVIDPDDTWRTPEPFMNFSVGGLSFEDDTPAAVGNMVLVEMGVGIDPKSHCLKM